MVMVSNQRQALEFYTQQLGFEKKVDVENENFRWIIVGPKNSKTVISIVEPDRMKHWNQEKIEQAKNRIGASTGIWFFTKNIDEVYHDLKSKGVIISQPKKEKWGIMSDFYDQDKNSFGLVGESKE